MIKMSFQAPARLADINNMYIQVSLKCSFFFYIRDIVANKRCFLLFKYVRSETKESFVTRTNALLVGTLISTE